MQTRPVHPFPARMAPELALHSLKFLPEGSTVLDPMSGSGVVLRQALKLGHRAIGFDVDPLAVLMSRVWTSTVDRKIVIRELKSVIDEAHDVDLRTPLPWRDVETRDFMAYWFAPSQRQALTRLASVFERRRTARLGDARRAAVDLLQVALSRIIITKEQTASLARDTSHSRPHRVAVKSDYNVFDGFVRSTQIVLDRVDAQDTQHSATVNIGDARALVIARHSVDAIMTSPPYLNAIDYMRGHKMSLVWLGYSLDELRNIRSGAIGAERGADAAAEEQARDIAKAMCNTKRLTSRQYGMVIRYANDLRQMMSQSARVLKPAGKATYVVGNSCLNDVFIRNSEGVVCAGELAGLRLTSTRERDLPDASRYLPMTDTGSLSKRMRTETVLTFKPKVQRH